MRFYDFLRVSPRRVLFGLLDVAGPLNERFQRAVRRFYDSRRKAS